MLQFIVWLILVLAATGLSLILDLTVTQALVIGALTLVLWFALEGLFDAHAARKTNDPPATRPRRHSRERRHRRNR